MEVERGTAQGAGICGVILIVCGLASAISGFIWLGIHGFGGFGIWSGFALIIAGVLGVIVWWKRHKGVLIGFIVVTIIMIFIASGQAITSVVLYGLFKVFADPGKCNKSYGSCTCTNGFDIYFYHESYCDEWDALLNSLLAITIFNVTGTIICFVGPILSCIGTCATTQSQPGAVIVQQPVVMTTTQHSYVAQQPGYVQQHGYAPQQAGYPQQQQPGYAPQTTTVNPPQGAPPEYTEKH